MEIGAAVDVARHPKTPTPRVLVPFRGRIGMTASATPRRTRGTNVARRLQTPDRHSGGSETSVRRIHGTKANASTATAPHAP